MVEVLTGLPPDAAEGTSPRPEYDPAWRNLMEREAAKVAELAAGGQQISKRTLLRMRQRYEAEGLWGLVDGRSRKPPAPVPGTGRTDERVVEAVTEALAGQTDLSTGDRKRLMLQAGQILAAKHGEEAVKLLPTRATFYRLVNSLAKSNESFGSATVRRQRALRPVGPFTPSMAARPGEIVQIDSTRLDVMAVLDDGVVARPELTIAVDVTTRTICAALLRPAGTKGVDAAVLPARMLVPEPMRPGWSQTLAMSDSILPHQRLMAVDARGEKAAAKPVIVPDTIVIDHGKVFVSDTFSSACSLLGISVQLARPRTPTDKAIVRVDQLAVLPVRRGLHRLRCHPSRQRPGLRGGLDPRPAPGPPGRVDHLLAAASPRGPAQPLHGGADAVAERVVRHRRRPRRILARRSVRGGLHRTTARGLEGRQRLRHQGQLPHLRQP
ncbi:hypothetical protein [Streptomyces sp. NPDC056982]|uniref:hypothetical protein n=1 Tax=Streptomyces sp. NPDC056982 TaxID=3345986 RepID=UPI003639D1EA